MQNDRRVDGSSVLTEMQSYSLFLFLCCRLDFYLFLSLFFKQSLLIAMENPIESFLIIFCNRFCSFATFKMAGNFYFQKIVEKIATW